MNGLRPVVEMQFDAFAYPAFEQITSHLAKLRNRTRGRMGLPIVIRVPYGGGIGGVEHHCDSSEAYYTHTAGLRVVTPGTPATPTRCCGRPSTAPIRSSSLSRNAATGRRRQRSWATRPGHRPGRRPPAGPDVTLIAYGGTVRTALEAAEEARDHGHSAEVIDLSSLSPFDDDTVAASVRRTGRAVVIHEASRFCGYGAEVVARLSEQASTTSKPHPAGHWLRHPHPPPNLEEHHPPGVDRILDAIDQLAVARHAA